MKTLTILVVGIIAIGCNPNAELEKKVVGTYESKDAGTGHIYKLVFLENGIVENYFNNSKIVDYDWKIVDGKIHTIGGPHEGDMIISIINEDGSISNITSIKDGKRTDIPEERQPTYKKIK